MFVVFLEKEGDAHSLPPTISPLTLLVRVPSMTAFDLEVRFSFALRFFLILHAFIPPDNIFMCNSIHGDLHFF